MLFQVIDADYTTNGKPLVRLFGRTGKGNSACLFYDNFMPYFYARLKENAIEKIMKIDGIINTDGGDIWLFGGAELVSTFMNKRLVSEILLSIHPVILGGGKPLFKNIESRIGLNFIDQQTYDTGLVQVRYELMPWFDPEKLHFLG